MDIRKIRSFVDTAWDQSILPALKRYITIPNLSPAFDPEWGKNGHMDRAVDLISHWIRTREIPDVKLEVVRLGERTPLLYVEVPGAGDDTVVLYGHLDKQPPMEGWEEGLGPWTPVVREGRLYGRGAADDGYAAFASVTAIQALKQQAVPHARCVVLIEGCEESGSPDLPHYVEALKDRIGSPTLVICLDSGCGNYDQLWFTTSLRGVIGGVLKVEVLREAVHSGDGTGIIPSSFRILRRILSRLENEETGAILPREFHVDIPEERLRQAGQTAAVLGKTIWSKYPWAGDTRPIATDGKELLLNRTWRPQLEITGADGFPPTGQAGNVVRPVSAAKVSLRLPPTADAAKAAESLKRLLVSDPPYGARVTYQPDTPAPGWNAPAIAPWLETSARQASIDFFGREACYMGEGGTIPFMGMLGERFPRAQFLITGVLGPQSNAHAPNEFLDLATAKRLTASAARILADHHRSRKG